MRPGNCLPFLNTLLYLCPRNINMVFIWFCMVLYDSMLFLYDFIKCYDHFENNYNFWQFFYNVWYFWPLHFKVRTQKIHFPSTKNSGGPFSGPKLQLYSSFSHTFDQNFERSTGNSNVPPDFWTSDIKNIQKIFVFDHRLANHLRFYRFP